MTHKEKVQLGLLITEAIEAGNRRFGHNYKKTWLVFMESVRPFLTEVVK